MPELLKLCLAICPLVFLAGFVDSIAGGGGLISLPAYLVMGLPPHLAAGTNKVVSGLGALTASGKYIKSGRIWLDLAIFSALGALAGSFIGTRIALMLSGSALKLVILCALPIVAVIMMIRRNTDRPEGSLHSRGKAVDRLLCTLIGLVIGCYDGLIGPGTGTFMILAFSMVLGMDLLYASGCAKVGNLASNIASAVVYIINGKVMFSLVIPAAAFSILGNYLGARCAIKTGAKRVRSIMLLVLLLLFVRLVYDIVN